MACLNAFLIDGSRYSFSIMHFDHLSFRIEVINFPIYDIRAIGLKLDGIEGAFLAGP